MCDFNAIKFGNISFTNIDNENNTIKYMTNSNKLQKKYNHVSFKMLKNPYVWDYHRNVNKYVDREFIENITNYFDILMKKFTLPYYHNSILIIPNNKNTIFLKYIDFGNVFNKPIEGIFPDNCSIETIIFGENFDQNISNLPKSLLHLRIKNPIFTNHISNLPINLVSLNIGCYFCSTYIYSITTNINLRKNTKLKEVSFEGKYNFKLDDNFNNNHMLKKISIGTCVDNFFDHTNDIIKNLEKIKIERGYCKENIFQKKYDFKSLKYLSYVSNGTINKIDYIPHNLKVLKLFGMRDNICDQNVISMISNLKCLKRLVLEIYENLFTFNCDQLPNITKLELSNYGGKILLQGKLPETV